MIFFLLWALFVLAGEMRKRWLVGVASAIALLVLASSVYGQYCDLAKYSKYRQAQNQDLRRLGARLASSPATFVTIGAAFPYEGLLPFESLSYLSGARLLGLGGMNQSPVQKKQLADNGINDLFAALCDGTISYVVLNEGTIGILKQYLQEHYRKNVKFTPAFVGRTFRVYRLLVPPSQE